jgi:predicted PurR-regulated permease PerM
VTDRDPLRTTLYALVLTILVGWLLHVGRPILAPVVIAILITFIVNGLATLLNRIPRVSRLPDWGRELLAAAIICFALVEIAALIAWNVGAFASRAAVYQEALAAMYQRIAEFFDFDEAATLQAIRAEAAQALNLPGLVRTAAGSAASVLAVLIFVLLNVGFMLGERRSFFGKLSHAGLDAAGVARARAIVRDVNDRVGVYLAMKTLMNVALGLLSWAIMLAFGVEFATGFAIIIALLNYIPYFGSFIGVAFPAAASLVAFADPTAVVWLVLCLAAAQLLIGNVIEPQVMGDALNLSPWVILIALTVWGSLWGVVGAVFSVPITAVMMVVLSEFVATRPIAVFLSRDGRVGPAEGSDRA